MEKEPDGEKGKKEVSVTSTETQQINQLEESFNKNDPGYGSERKFEKGERLLKNKQEDQEATSTA